MSGYIRVLLKEFYTEVKLEILSCHQAVSLDDATLDKLLYRGEPVDGGNYYDE
jgi:hypothetical protein